MYLESYLVADAQAPNQSTNGTGSRLTMIEMTMIAGVTISAISLALNFWNTMQKRSE